MRRLPERRDVAERRLLKMPNEKYLLAYQDEVKRITFLRIDKSRPGTVYESWPSLEHLATPFSSEEVTKELSVFIKALRKFESYSIVRVE